MMQQPEQQSANAYRLTEREISASCARAVPHPIRLFDLVGLGVDAEEFILALAPTYEDLPWDTYDVRQAQINYVVQHNPSCVTMENVALMKRYYEGDVELLRELAAWLPNNTRGLLHEFTPCRRRASASYRLTYDDKPEVCLLPSSAFRQEQVEDYRSWPRAFAPMSPTVSGCHLLHQFLIRVGAMVREWEPSGRRMKLIVHQVSTVARTDHPGTSSPEGAHQDGADYIVSALVVAKSEVDGGMSRLFFDDTREPFFSTTLAPRQGLFHADARTCIWHDATPITYIGANEQGTGFRNTIGVDVYVEG
jgi:hypothetical protein